MGFAGFSVDTEEELTRAACRGCTCRAFSRVAEGIVLTMAFSATVSLAGLGWLPAGINQFVQSRFEAYYTGIQELAE